MTNDELLDELRAANPHAAPATTPQPTMSPSARFEEITMLNPDPISPPGRNPASPMPWWRTPMVAAPTALALVAILAVGALVFSTVTAPSAYALVNEAAMNSAEYESGRVDITVDIRQDPLDEVTGSFNLEYRYDGADYELFYNLDDMTFAPGNEDPNFDIVVDEVTVRRIGDTIYSRIPTVAGGAFVAQPAGEFDPWRDVGFGVNPEAATPASVVDILARAQDYSEVSETDGTTTYRGSIETQVIRDIGAENLPPGLSMMAEGTGDDLPETLGISASIRDGELVEIQVDIIGDTPSGYSDGTLTSTFSELGQPQTFEVPSDDDVVAQDDMLAELGVPDDMIETLNVLEELEARRPGLCSEIFLDMELPEDPTVPIDNDTFAETNEAFIACLEAEGEGAAADAFRSLQPGELGS